MVQCVTDVAWENWLLDTSMSAGRPAELLTQNTEQVVDATENVISYATSRRPDKMLQMCKTK